MLTPDPCAAAVASDLKSLWTFLQSDEARLLFITLATLRALVYLLLKDPRREARELACAIVAVTLFLSAIGIQEYHPLAKSQTVAWCGDTETDTKIATTARPAIPGG